MNEPSDKWIVRLDELAGAIRDGELTGEQSSELEDLLRSIPGARRRFAEQMQLISLLDDEHEAARLESFKNAIDPANALQDQMEDRSSGGTRRISWPFAIAVSLAFIAFTLAAIDVIPRWRSAPTAGSEPGDDLVDRGVAVVTQSVDAVWADDVRLAIGSSVAPGRAVLTSGLVQLEFYRGAVVVIEGPAEIEFVDANRMVCQRGRIRANVPPHAEGFAVESPNFELVDLGTEFGMDVSEDGSGQVHVFDGKVELYESGSNRSPSSRHEVLAASGMLVSAQGDFETSAQTDGVFVSSDQLRELADRKGEVDLNHWREQSRSMSSDDDVLIHFGFERDGKSRRSLVSQLDGDRSLDGAIVGCTWEQGRWQGKGSLEFKRPGDRVRFSLPGEFESLTYSAWVRIDGLDRPFSALVLTNGYDEGEPHWQLRDDGRLLLGIRLADGHVTYDSDPFLDIRQLGKWMHIATVYDGPGGWVTHYVDGRVVGRIPIETGRLELRLGESAIGNWGTPVNYSPQKIRNLNGRMDELTLFRKALSAGEVKGLYEGGRP